MGKIVRPSLAELANQINAQHRQAEMLAGQAIQAALECGRLLLEAKSQVEHGQWESWLEKHFMGSKSTAKRYIRAYREWPQIEALASEQSARDRTNRSRVSDLSLRQALELIADHREDTESVNLAIAPPAKTAAARIPYSERPLIGPLQLEPGMDYGCLGENNSFAEVVIHPESDEKHCYVAVYKNIGTGFPTVDYTKRGCRRTPEGISTFLHVLGFQPREDGQWCPTPTTGKYPHYILDESAPMTVATGEPDYWAAEMAKLLNQRLEREANQRDDLDDGPQFVPEEDQAGDDWEDQF